MVQHFKIPLYGLQVFQVPVIHKQAFRDLDLLPLSWYRLLVIQLKNIGKALRRRPSPLPVAPSRCLNHGIHSRQLPVHGLKIQIHPRLHQAGGHHDTSLPLF